MPVAEFHQLMSDLPGVLSQSRAPRTVAKYEGAFQRWKAWARTHKVSSLPADPFHVALYVVKLLQDASTVAPVTAALCSISWFHSVNGFPDPSANPMVRNVSQAARRITAQPKNRKLPVSRQQVRAMARELSKSGTLKDLQTLTLVVIAYAGLLRWDDLAHIYADEVVIQSGYAAVFLESRKNDQLRQGHWVFLCRWNQEESTVCPVALLEELLERGQHLGHSPLFGKVRRQKKRSVIRGKMSYSRARELVREALSRIGVDPEGYGLHSLRSGGASVAAASGIPDRLIQRQGGWRSESAMRNYFQESLPALLKVSKALAS